ncbi:MAG: DNA primase [Opitutales bacterium]|nr:DNA primase [Opitutales bacterium]
MPRIARKTIEDIRARVDLYDVVSPHVELKRAGASWKGLSPFNSERTPSFYVHPDKGFYKCFSSGKAGDHFSFVEEVENISFEEAVETLAKRFNISIEYEAGGPSREERSLRQELFDLHEVAAQWFRDAFQASNEEGEYARDYWTEQRKFSAETGEDYKIGWAPTDSFALHEKLKQKGYSPQALQQSGLFYLREEHVGAQKARCRFAGRLMIPIRDNNSRIVAFTARVTDLTREDDVARDAKYVNSPETPLFVKSNILFNLDVARKATKENRTLYMVEGQLDAIRCVEQGIKSVVAPQGTAITDQQLHQLRRIVDRLVFVLDGDRAGKDAALRALPMALKAGLEPRFVALADGQDPDSIAQAGGTDALKKCFENSMGTVAFTKAALDSGDPPSPSERQGQLRSLFGILNSVESAILLEEYIEETARVWQLPPDALRTDFAQFRKRQTGRKSNRTHQPQTNTDSPDAAPTPETAQAQDSTLTRVESQLLWFILHNGDFLDFIAANFDINWIHADSVPARMLRKILVDVQHGAIEPGDPLIDSFETSKERQLFFDLQSIDLNLEEPEKSVKQAINNAFTNWIQINLDRLSHQIAQLSSDSEETIHLMRERIDYRKMRASLPFPS